MSTMTLNELKPGAVAITNDGKIVVITGHDLNRPRRPIRLKVKAGGTEYISPLDGFKAVVGQVDLDAFNKAAAPLFPSVPPVERGSPFPPFGVKPNEDLKDLKVGDLIRVRHGSRVVTATFGGYSWSRPKYPISYTINGKRWKGPMDVIVGKALFGSAEVQPGLDAEEARIARAEAIGS